MQMLPVMAFPVLTIMGSPIANAMAGDKVDVTFNSTMSGTMSAAIYSRQHSCTSCVHAAESSSRWPRVRSRTYGRNELHPA